MVLRGSFRSYRWWIPFVQSRETPVDRESLRAVQTPQGFRAEALRAAHAAGGDATDDATLVEALGHTVVLVAGDLRNLKITRPTDIGVVRALLENPSDN